jgi:hypothetical protein
MIRAEVITPASAHLRMAAADGASSESGPARAQAASRVAAAPPPAELAAGRSGAAEGADTDSMLGGRTGPPKPVSYTA